MILTPARKCGSALQKTKNSTTKPYRLFRILENLLIIQSISVADPEYSKDRRLFSKMGTMFFKKVSIGVMQTQNRVI